MKKLSLENITDADIRTWPNPDPKTLPEDRRDAYVARRSALMAVVGGMTIRAAAKAYCVSRSTLSSCVEKALLPGPDGHPLGFRACIPYRHRQPKPEVAGLVEPPAAKGPGAFSRLVAATEGLAATIDGYSGPLPTGKRKCRRFDRFFRTVLNAVREAHGKAGYPFDVPDHGRRALREYVKRTRLQRKEAARPEVDQDAPLSSNLRGLFQDGPLDRIEYDAHTVDVELQLSIDTPDGSPVLRPIQQITLLVAICAVTRYVLGYVLRFGAYNQLDVLRLFHRVLQPWLPRELIVPNMQYGPGAVIGVQALTGHQAARGLLLAGDNAFAHLAHAVVGNLRSHHRGVLNYGKAHIAEARGIIEAFFRRLEEGALREIAGAFQPGSMVEEGRTKTNYLRPEDHPIHAEAFFDLIDVIVAGHNITPHSGLQLRTPAERLRTHIHGGGWIFEAADTDADAARLTTVRIHPTVRGNQKTGKLPYIEWGHAKYRSPKLEGAWSRVGKRHAAEVNLEDVRTMVLLDTDGSGPWSKLHALPPWDASPHDLLLRKSIMSARSRGLLEIEGSSDAVAAYHEMVRTKAWRDGAGVDQLAQLNRTRGSTTPSAKTSRLQPVAFAPREGRFSFGAGRKEK